MALIQQQFVELINEELRKRQWSRSDLARAMGCRPSMVIDYLNGRKSPGPDVIERFFSALGLVAELKIRPL